jgi:O-6-methylguanine DNA methyltransferase
MGIVHTASFETSAGPMFVASTDRGLAYLGLPHANGRGFQGWMRRHARDMQSKAGYAPNRDAIIQITEYLESKRQEFDLELDLRATAFQRKVYEAVSAIGYGETASYGEIARRIGEPNAVRAVGAANGANPIPLVIPCHRVVQTGGKLGGYGGGLELKARLLALEHAAPAPGDLL